VRELRLLLARSSEDLHERFEGFEIVSPNRRLDGLLDAMVARDEGGVREPHGRDAQVGRETLSRQPVPPRVRPAVKRTGLGEQGCDSRVFGRVVDRGAQPTKEDGVVDAVRRHPGQQVGRERGVVVLFAREPDFRAQDARVRRGEVRGK